MVRGLTVNQVYDVKVYGRSSRPCRANKKRYAGSPVVEEPPKKLAVHRGVWSTPPVLGTGNRWFESSCADLILLA